MKIIIIIDFTKDIIKAIRDVWEKYRRRDFPNI